MNKSFANSGWRINLFYSIPVILSCTSSNIRNTRVLAQTRYTLISEEFESEKRPTVLCPNSRGYRPYPLPLLMESWNSVSVRGLGYSCSLLLRMQTQREGLGLLKYQAMPSLRDLAHDGVLCTFSNRSAPDRGSVRAGSIDCPSRTKSHPAGSLSSSQPGGPPCWASPLAIGLKGH
jgi:hypothetical protein